MEFYWFFCSLDLRAYFCVLFLVRADSIYQRIHFWIRCPITMTLTSSATACTMAFMHPLNTAARWVFPILSEHSRPAIWITLNWCRSPFDGFVYVYPLGVIELVWMMPTDTTMEMEIKCRWKIGVRDGAWKWFRFETKRESRHQFITYFYCFMDV